MLLVTLWVILVIAPRSPRVMTINRCEVIESIDAISVRRQDYITQKVVGLHPSAQNTSLLCNSAILLLWSWYIYNLSDALIFLCEKVANVPWFKKRFFKWFSASGRFKAQQQRWSETFKVLGSNKRPTKHLKDLNHLKLLRFISHFVFSLGERILLSSHFLKLYDCQKSFEANFLVFIHPKVFKYWMSEKVIGKDKAGFLGPSEKFGFVSCLGPSPERP